MDLMSGLERLKAKRDIMEKDIERDLKVLSDKWDISDIESAIESIDSIEAEAAAAGKKRDDAIAKAYEIINTFQER